jgi:HlyD family secretion protein
MKYLIFSIAFIVITACSSNESDFDATGTFESTEIIVSSEANGKIMELNLQEGDRLRAGLCGQYAALSPKEAARSRPS